MMLARLHPRLGAGDVLGFCERQEVTLFGGIEEIGRCHGAIPDCNGTNPISLYVCGYRSVIEQHRELSLTRVRSQHGFEHCQRNARLMGKTRDRTTAGI